MRTKILDDTCGATTTLRLRVLGRSMSPWGSLLAKQLQGDGFVSSRTQIVCLHEGERGRSIDPLFILMLLKALDPAWIRPWKGSNIIRPVDCGGRNNLIARMHEELQTCIEMGADTTL